MSVTWQLYVDYIKAKGNIDECMIIDSEDGAHWAATSPDFILREYTATIVQEDGTDKEEVVNEATNILQLMSGKSRPPQGLRLNGGKKQQILRSFIDEETNNYTVYGKIMKNGSSLVHATKCIIIATFDETKGHSAPACNTIVSEVAKYLQQATWPTSPISLGGPPSVSAASTWQPYIDTMLLAKGHISAALICSKIDGTIWASTPDFQLKTYDTEIPQEDGTDVVEQVNEAANLVKLMEGGPKPSQGLRLNQEKKYTILRSYTEDEIGYIIIGKKMKGGCCVCVSNSAIIVGVFDETKGHQSSNCNTNVQELTKYLRANNS